MAFNVGDKVRFISAERHALHPEWFPAIGTIGTVCEGGWVQWPVGSTSGDDRWQVSDIALELVEAAPAAPRKFKVGDKVRGNSIGEYSITRKGWVGYVTCVGSGTSISVCRDKHGYDSVYWVNEEHFDLVGPSRDADGNLICSECGCIIEDDDDYETINDEPVCRDCVDREFTTCDICGEYHRNDEFTEIGGHMVCDDCRDSRRRFFQCPDCDEWFDDYEDDVVTLYDGRRLCRSCVDYGDYATCDDCGRWFPTADLNYDDDDDVYRCADCEERERRKVIHNYGYKPEPVFKAGTHDTFWTDASIKELLFGVELEIDKGDDDASCAKEIVDNTEDIYCKHDGSLSCGVEIVSHPCTLEYHMKSLGWAKICEIARKWNFLSQDARTCGLHVHVGRNQMGDSYQEQDKTAGRLVLLVDRHWDSLVKFTRRFSKELDKWAARPHVHYEYCKLYGRALETVANKTVDSGRYQAVNLENDATVEFRLFNGTLKASTIIATLQFVSNLVTYAKEHTAEECMASKWTDITGVANYPELTEYLKNRELVEGYAPTEYDRKPAVKDGEVESTYADRLPEEGDVVKIINADGSGIQSLHNYIGETATIAYIRGHGDDMDYLLDFGHDGEGLHDGGLLDRPTGYWVYRDNFAVIAA